ncbi:FMN-dependent NADH-azoreductase [Candidatus Protofrankia californiensis]|uniref:FMN-dependent NADH-azoreductase n=1 Tax=Candidatus Protofrankia californiensis TaxID=1839754 RepID=UPI0010414B74|nr:NAD(P)H-dependent oxidoreductase [Candidatus Protofrankia californiensis]
MPTLLHIDSSVSPTSASRAVAGQFTTAWTESHPGGTVIYRDLVANPPAHLGWEAVSASVTPADTRSPEQAAAWAEREELIAELEAADALLLSVPMYNWSITSTVKAWIDAVIVVDRTVSLTGGSGALSGKPVTIVTARGGAYGPGTPQEGNDYQEPYLRHVLAALGATDINFINVELTLASVTPAMADLIPLAEQSRAVAEKAVAARAAA